MTTPLFNADNWYQWSYGDGPAYGLSTPGAQLKVKYGKLPAFKPFKYALLDNARSTIDHFPNEKFNLLISGGVDCELMLRTYLAVKHPVHAHIFRYENDWNIYDVSHAVLMCENLNVPYTIHDFNLTQFFEGGNFVRYSSLAQSDRPRALVQLAFPSIIGEGVVIGGSSEPHWYRPHDDYTKKAHWRCVDFEHDIALDRYTHRLGIPAIMQWYRWTPELTLAWFSLKWFADLLGDNIQGKLGMTSTKIQGYREAFQDIPFRFKKTGFEKIDHLVNPAEEYLMKVNGGLHYRQQVSMSADELWMEMTGHGYYSR
jgi:hypothetical protein